MKLVEKTHRNLRSQANKVAIFDDRTRQLANKMLQYIIKRKDAVGLAATQIGLSKQLIVMILDKGSLVACNPEILEYRGTPEKKTEGCLSLPNETHKILRYPEIVLKYQDLKGVYHKVVVDGYAAQIIQHEVNHCRGLLIDEQSNEN